MCRGFPLSFVFELCLQKALQLLLRPVPSLAPCEPSLPHCCSRGREKSEGAVKHVNWFPSLAGFFHLQSPGVYLCLQFSGKIKITQGRTSKSPRLPELEETSEILIESE